MSKNRAGAGAGSVFEHVAPPRVGRGPDPHVIGDEIHDVLQPVLAQRVGERRVGLAAADLGVQLVVVADVVAVRAARLRREVGRRVARADAELTRDTARSRPRRQRETAMDLQPIGARRHVAGSMRQRLGHEVLETRRSRMTAPGR